MHEIISNLHVFLFVVNELLDDCVGTPPFCVGHV